jgi:molybdenum cofactor sulfurtransferase
MQGLTDQDVAANHAAGHVCGDNVDLIDGKPTGSIRISFGYFSVQVPIIPSVK